MFVVLKLGLHSWKQVCANNFLCLFRVPEGVSQEGMVAEPGQT